MAKFPERNCCADYLKRHKRKIRFQRNFRSVKDLGIDNLKKVLEADTALRVHESHFVCQNCFRNFKEDIEHMEEESSQSNQGFQTTEEVMESIKAVVGAPSAVSPLKPPRSVKKGKRLSYAKRKADEITRAAVRNIRCGIRTAYGIKDIPSQFSCCACASWKKNLHTAYIKCTSFRERCRLLSLIHLSLTIKEVQRFIPEATKHAILKARKIAAEQGVWSLLEPYCREKLSEADTNKILEYYTKDELDCSRQSPNKKDVVRVRIDGKAEFISKRFMTRSLRETYSVYKLANPLSAVGLTKFISLRPEWVKCSPHREGCVWAYCANFELCLIGIKNASGSLMSTDDVQALCVCTQPSTKCFLGECEQCPVKNGLSLGTLGIAPDEEIVFAT